MNKYTIRRFPAICVESRSVSWWLWIPWWRHAVGYETFRQAVDGFEHFRKTGCLTVDAYVPLGRRNSRIQGSY